MTIRMVAVFQNYENYGESDQPYWKAKGGSEVALGQFPSWKDVPTGEAAQQYAASARDMVERQNNPMFERFLVDWSFVDAGEKTHDEKMFEEMLADGYARESERTMFAPDSLSEYLFPIQEMKEIVW